MTEYFFSKAVFQLSNEIFGHPKRSIDIGSQSWVKKNESRHTHLFFQGKPIFQVKYPSSIIHSLVRGKFCDVISPKWKSHQTKILHQVCF